MGEYICPISIVGSIMYPCIVCRAYLVRDSTTVPNSYVLTMYAKSVAKNFQILPVSV